MTLQEKIGQRLFGGFQGLHMSDDFIHLVQEYKIGNVVLFKHNVESREQLKQLCSEIQTLVRRETGIDAFIAIDQEGGSVTRLSDDAVNVPAEMAIAATGDPENAYLAARITAQELRALGINFNLAPVVDINNNPDNPIIGARCFGDTAETVVEYAQAAVRGYDSCGIISCAKHFPGHGDTAIDSHISLPLIDKSLEQLEQLELKPFRAMVEAGCPAIMTTHILFPQLEKDNVPATMSRTIITELLKEKMGFSGMVVSDSMEMDAIRRFYGTAVGAAAAAAAGVDLIMISHTAERLQEVTVAIRNAVEGGRISMDEMDKSVEKILSFKKRYCVAPSGQAGTKDAFSACRTLREKTITLVTDNLPALGAKPYFVGCADYRSDLVSNAQQNCFTFPKFMSEHIGGTARVTAADPDGQEIAIAAAEAYGSSCVVVNTYNGHLFDGQMKLVQELGKLKIPMIVVALRNPYDLSHLPTHVAGIVAWDYSRVTMELLVPILTGKKNPPGRLPVAILPELKG